MTDLLAFHGCVPDAPDRSRLPNVIGSHVKIDSVTLNVFTDRPFCGNPLGVIPDARGLDAAHMQATATAACR